jgi:hypothetical protein
MLRRHSSPFAMAVVSDTAAIENMTTATAISTSENAFLPFFFTQNSRQCIGHIFNAVTFYGESGKKSKFVELCHMPRVRYGGMQIALKFG